MAMVERRFRLNQQIKLPLDTVIVSPLPVAPPVNTPTLRVLNNSTGGCRSCETVGIPSSLAENYDDQFLAVSPSRATYVALRNDSLEAFRALLNGVTIKGALEILERSHSDPAGALRDILTAVVIRNFFENATTSNSVPDGAVLHFYVTNSCNLRCAHCYMSSGEPLEGELSTSEKLRVLDLFAKLHPKGQVTFSGGEALATPDIFVLLKSARHLGLRIQLYTNGVTVRPSNVVEIIRLVDVLQISLDGATALVNDQIRGTGTFDKIIAAIKLVNALPRSDHFLLRIAMTLTPTNADDIEKNLGDLLAQLRLNGNYKVSIGTATNMGRAQGNANLFSNIDEMRSLESRVIHGLTKRDILTVPVLSQNLFKKSCGHGGAITVRADGSIYPCSITNQPAIGNVRDPDALVLMAGVRNYIASSSIDNVEGCNRCAIRYFCGGICRVTNFARNGSYNISACTPEYKNSQIRTLIRRFETFKIGANVQ
jgi:radical SAM protein with 4Fe4S-binding SPASM domain